MAGTQCPHVLMEHVTIMAVKTTSLENVLVIFFLLFDQL